MKRYIFALLLLSVTVGALRGMNGDILRPIAPGYVQKIKERMAKGTGPKKLLNLVNHSCKGNLALKAYVIGKTWDRKAFDSGAERISKLCQIFDEISRNAEQANDQLAQDVIRIMSNSYFRGVSPIVIAIEFNSERGLGFLIQMGEFLSMADLSMTISKDMPHLTQLLFQANCPVRNRYALMSDQPLVIALKKGDEATARLILPKVNLSEKFEYDWQKPSVTIAEYLNLEYRGDTDEAYQIKYNVLTHQSRFTMPEKPNYAKARALLEKLSKQ